MYWITFIISSAVIVFAGSKITTYADQISDRFDLGKVWIGAALLGIVTSLPEAITSLVAIIGLNADSLAVGNLLGSNMFNPMIIVVLDILYRKGGITNDIKSNPSHDTSGFFALVLAIIVFLEIAFGNQIGFLHVGRFSLGSLMICILYFAGMKMLSSEKDCVVSGVGIKAASSKDNKFHAVILKTVLSAAAIVVSAVFLSKSADQIAFYTGLGRTFVGSIFLAIATSLPELVVSIAAFKIGSMDLAIGNIFGSNMTNMFIIFICSLVKGSVPLLSRISDVNSITALIGISLIVIIMVSIHRKKNTMFGIGIDSVLMTTVFLCGMKMLYDLR